MSRFPSNLSYQGSTFIELFTTQGSNPMEKFRISDARATRHIKRVFEKTVKSYIIDLPLIPTVPNTRVILPKHEKQSLGLIHRFLVIQLQVPTNSMYIELVIRDTHKNRRRLIFSSSFREINRTPLHAQLPLTHDVLPRNLWLNLCFDLQSLVSFAFDSESIEHHSLDEIHIGSVCRLRKIFISSQNPITEVMIPQKLQFLGNVDYDTRMLDRTVFDVNTDEEVAEGTQLRDSLSSKIDTSRTSSDRGSTPNVTHRDHHRMHTPTHHVAFGRRTKGAAPSLSAQPSPERPVSSPSKLSARKKEHNAQRADPTSTQHSARQRIPQKQHSTTPRIDKIRLQLSIADPRRSNDETHTFSDRASTALSQKTQAQESARSNQQNKIYDNTRYQSVGDENGDEDTKRYDHSRYQEQPNQNKISTTLEARTNHDYSQQDLQGDYDRDDNEDDDVESHVEEEEGEEGEYEKEDEEEEEYEDDEECDKENAEEEVQIQSQSRVHDTTPRRSYPEHVVSLDHSNSEVSSLADSSFMLSHWNTDSEQKEDVMFEIIDMLENEVTIADTDEVMDHPENGEGSHGEEEKEYNNEENDSGGYTQNSLARILSKSPELPREDNFEDEDYESDDEDDLHHERRQTFEFESDTDDEVENDQIVSYLNHSMEDSEDFQVITEEQPSPSTSRALTGSQAPSTNSSNYKQRRIFTPHHSEQKSQDSIHGLALTRDQVQSDEIELIYDETLNLYFDPVSNCFYTPKNS